MCNSTSVLIFHIYVCLNALVSKRVFIAFCEGVYLSLLQERKLFLKKKKASLRPIESLQAFWFKSVNVQFRTSSLSSALIACSSLFICWLCFLFSQQLSWIVTFLQGHQATAVPFVPSHSSSRDFASGFSFCSQMPNLSVAAGASCLTHPPRGKRCPFPCAGWLFLFSPVLPASPPVPSLQTLSVPVSPICKNFGPYPIIVQLFPSWCG